MIHPRNMSRLTGAGVVFLGFIVLLGWAGDIAAFKTVLPGLGLMKANTAACFVLAGASLLLAVFAQPTPGPPGSLPLAEEKMADGNVARPRRKPALLVARSLALLVFGLGLATLAEYLWTATLGWIPCSLRRTHGLSAYSCPAG